MENDISTDVETCKVIQFMLLSDEISFCALSDFIMVLYENDAVHINGIVNRKQCVLYVILRSSHLLRHHSDPPKRLKDYIYKVGCQESALTSPLCSF